jgi:hypothetical protein
MSIVSAKYLYAEDGVTKTHIQLSLGTNDAGDTTYKHIPIATNSNDYVETMAMVAAGELTIADAD